MTQQIDNDLFCYFVGMFGLTACNHFSGWHFIN